MPKAKLTQKQLNKQRKDKQTAAANAQEFSGLRTHPDRLALRKNARAFWQNLAVGCPARQAQKAQFLASVMVVKLRAGKVQAASSGCGHGCACHDH